MKGAAENPLSDLKVYIAFAGLAVLAGPVSGYLSGAFLYAANTQVLFGQALCSALAGIVLFGLSAIRRQKRLSARQWMALLLLLIPQWCSVQSNSLVRVPHWMRGIGWGTGLLLTVAAPLWLGLLSALNVAEVKVPRAVVGGGIAGLFAVCLVLPLQAYGVAWSQAAMLSVQVFLNTAIVISWAYAAPRLTCTSASMAAGGYLLLSAAADGAYGVISRRGAWQSLDCKSAWEPLLLQTAVMACVWVLWFWLLDRMTLAAFSMRSLAAWTAALALGLADFGLGNWRVDVALVVAVGAIVIGLRAQVSDEQPTALGLGET